MFTHDPNEADELLKLTSFYDELTDTYVNKSWERDQYLLLAVETGNKKLINQLREIFPESGEDIHEHYFGNPVIKEDKLRERKNGLIIRNTICRVGAGRGGVPPRYLHNISEKYILLIERSTSAETLISSVSDKMIDEYIDLVNHVSITNYSPMIKKVVTYISEHIQEPLSLSEIADYFHVNPAHLSREFKKETDYNLSTYVNRRKIEIAKYFLVQNDKTVSEVSDMLSYNSSSYFSKTFKRITGESPSEYKDRETN